MHDLRVVLQSACSLHGRPGMSDDMFAGARRRGDDLLVKELMTRRVSTIAEHESVAMAHQMMLWAGTRHLPVLRDEILAGVISDRDVLPAIQGKNAHAIAVREVMTMHVETISPDATVTEASAKMASLRIDCLPVVKEHRLVGIVTSSDILAERGRLVFKASAGPSHIPLARDVMHKRLLTVGPETSLREAIEKLVRAEVRHLPVVDTDGRVVGMLSDRDLRTAVGDPREAMDNESLLIERATVEQVMRTAVVVVQEDASIVEIADAFLDERIGAVPVVDADEVLVGIVSYVDVLAHLVGRKRMPDASAS